MPRIWRTLIRVTHVGIDHVCVILPGWNPTKKIVLPKDLFPNKGKGLKSDDKFFGYANIGEESPANIVVEGIHEGRRQR